MGVLPITARTLIPLVRLSVESKGQWTKGAQYASPQVARQYEALNVAFRKEFGKDLEPREAARTFGRQVAIHEDPSLVGGATTATPGWSIHSYGDAIDFNSGVQYLNSPEWLWMREHAPAYGFTNTGLYFATKEPWHWDGRGRVTANLELAGTGPLIPIDTTHATPTEEEELMSAADDLFARIAVHTTGLTQTLEGRIQDAAGGLIRIQADERGIAVVGPGYFKGLLNDEEVNISGKVIAKHITGNEREFDVIAAIYINGQGATSAAESALKALDDWKATVATRDDLKALVTDVAPSVTLLPEQLLLVTDAARQGGADAIKSLSFVTVAQ